MAEADFEVNFNEVFRVGLADEDAQVRTASIEGLWEDEDVSLIPHLIACLKEDENVTVRAAAATSLGRFVLLGELGKIHTDFYTPAYDALLAAYRDEESVDVQREDSRYRVGVTVYHPKFGEGKIKGLEGSGAELKVTVQFPGYGTKKFLASYAPFTFRR